MFGQNDKVTLTLLNARDIDGNILPFQLKLPINCKYILPEGIASLDVFEYHEGLVNGGNIVFSIHIGEITSINNLINENAIYDVKISKNIVIPSIDSPICIQNMVGKKVVFATLNEQDIVIENKEKLIEVIDHLSDNFNEIKRTVNKVRILSKKKIK